MNQKEKSQCDSEIRVLKTRCNSLSAKFSKIMEEIIVEIDKKKDENQETSKKVS